MEESQETTLLLIIVICYCWHLKVISWKKLHYLLLIIVVCYCWQLKLENGLMEETTLVNYCHLLDCYCVVV